MKSWVYMLNQCQRHFKGHRAIIGDFDHMIPWESIQSDYRDISKTYHQTKSKWESFALATGWTDKMKCQYIYLNK